VGIVGDRVSTCDGDAEACVSVIKYIVSLVRGYPIGDGGREVRSNRIYT
jgi:hypothetical protein